MPYADSDGCRLHWESRGAGVPVVLTHGFGSTGEFWEGTVDALAAVAEVVSWDLRGHGASDAPEDDAAYSHAIVVEDLDTVRRAAGFEQAVFVGFSLGGFITLQYAMRHPERVRALGLCGTGPGFRNPEKREQWNAYCRSWDERLRDEGLASLQSGAGTGAATRHRSADGIARVARNVMVQQDATVMDFLGQVSWPTFVAVGENDRLLGASQYLADKIQQATFVSIPAADHPAPVQNPEAFNTALIGFVSQFGMQRSRRPRTSS